MKNDLTSLQQSLDSIASGEPVYQRWQEYRGRALWAGAADGKAGTQHLEYPSIEAPLVRGRLLMVPTGQAAPTRTEDTDTVYLGLESDVEFTVGTQTLVVKPLDILCVPAGTPHGFANLSLANALLCGIYAKSDGAPTPPKAERPAPTLMEWDTYRRDFHWTLPWSEQFGFHRGSGPLIISDGLRGHTVRIPTGQTTPWHYAARDMLFMGIHHDVEFKAANKSFRLGPHDFLIIPAGTPYSYHNHGLAECVFFSIGGKLPPGRKGTYFTADPGWPIRADAQTMTVEIDAHGDARVVDGAMPAR